MGCVALRCAYTLERDICPHGRVHSGDVYCVTCITYLRTTNFECPVHSSSASQQTLDQPWSFLSLLPLTQTNSDCRTVLLYFPSSRSHGCTRHSNMIEPRNTPSSIFWFLVRLDHHWCYPTQSSGLLYWPDHMQNEPSLSKRGQKSQWVDCGT